MAGQCSDGSQQWRVTLSVLAWAPLKLPCSCTLWRSSSHLCCPGGRAHLLAVRRPWPSVLQVLWPYLLEFLTPVRFTAALTPLCRSLVHLALKRREAGADDFLIEYNSNGVEAPPPCPYTLSSLFSLLSALCPCPGPAPAADPSPQPSPPAPGCCFCLLSHPSCLLVHMIPSFTLALPCNCFHVSCPANLPSPFALTTRLLVSRGSVTVSELKG